MGLQVSQHFRTCSLGTQGAVAAPWHEYVNKNHKETTAAHFQASEMVQRVEVTATELNEPSDSLKW